MLYRQQQQKKRENLSFVLLNNIFFFAFVFEQAEKQTHTIILYRHYISSVCFIVIPTEQRVYILRLLSLWLCF